ncbi:SPOR domain-containing protein [Pseudomonas eucalypticola]|uniref:SPOR domain-containing protein n=1 Tax=Pseudomonas eucalypticola TaxID=2599595 RepID=A0A7D5GZF1_9PSED|nr:SPOR domain-containing protein [Pseudomonas eucalypticola]QKZ03665.1 SPOR domain-containing protein [Pseudomonas eucalypticola]
MALLDNVFKQRMVGALVLIALAVIFLPMLFSRQDEQRQVRVDAPEAPQAPVVQQVKVEPVPVPEQQNLPQDAESVEAQAAPTAPPPSMPVAPAPPAPPSQRAPVQTQAQAPAPAPKPAPVAKPAPAPAPVAKADPAASKIDANGLPVSWAVQLASLSNRASADSLQKSLRSQGYNAYVRSADGMNRVFVGPLIERAEAERLRDLISRQQNVKGFVVRFQPERN